MIHYRRFSLGGIPILFANSFPKSGTHLLTQVLKGFTKIGPVVESGLPAIVTFDSQTGEPRGEVDIQRDLMRLKPGDISYGHLHATESAKDFLCNNVVVSYFLLRDPRDVVVSHVYYVTEIETKHVHHKYYQEELLNFDERLRASILGRPESGSLFPNIKQRFEPYLGWIDQPQVLVLRFEDFVLARSPTVERIYEHAVRRGFPSSLTKQQSVETLLAGIDPIKSPTFRKGKVGDWKEKFSPENIMVFKDIAGDLLIQLGYEQSNDW
jgi:hypothetical protein